MLSLALFSFGIQMQVTGTVLDQDTSAPIEGAIVMIQGTDFRVETDINGQYTLPFTPVPFKVTAAAFPYFTRLYNVSTVDQVVDFGLEPIPLGTADPESPLNGADSCGCHDTISAQWLGSPMQKTGLNTWVWDTWDGTGTAGGMGGFVYKRDSVHRFATPNSDCSACHSPVHWLTDIENAGMGDDISNPNEDMEWGVQCEVCHRAASVDMTKTNFPGVDPEAFSFFRNHEVDLQWGLRPDVNYTNDIMRPAYNPILSAQLCSACHEDNTDHDDDGDFEDLGSVEHETTFSEWQDYMALNGGSGQTCIECHMPLTAENNFCIFGEVDRSGTVRSHDIRGTTPAFLESAVELSSNVSSDLSHFTVNVSLANPNTGHGVPTGVVIRNMLLWVNILDSEGATLAQISGGTLDPVAGVGDPNQGYFAGEPGHAFFLNMTDGVNQRIFYTEATDIAFDSRLKPGETYMDQFVFDLPKGIGSDYIDYEVNVIYRRSFRDFIDAKGWTTTGHGEPLADLMAPYFGHLMEQASGRVYPCSDRDITGDLAVDSMDLGQWQAGWLGTAPFGSPSVSSVIHGTAIVNCISP